MNHRFQHRTALVAVILLASAAVYALCIITNSAGAFRKYLNQDIPFNYHLHQSIPPDWIGPIDAGAQAWENLPSSFWEFNNAGTTSANTVAQDGINLVFFDLQGVNFPPGTNTIAFSATFTSFQGGYHAVESDLVWNARDFPPGLNGEPTQIDLQGTMSHEFGHHMGIGHAGPVGGPPGCGELLLSATMYGFASNGDTTTRSLHIDDIGAAALLYPTWKLQGHIRDATNSQPLEAAAIIADQVALASLIGPVESPQNGFFEMPGASRRSVSTASDGSYEAVALVQQFNASVEFFGYQSQNTTVSFNPPGGIGSTEVITLDFNMQPSPLAQITGVVMDSLSGAPLQSSVSVYGISDKPGVPSLPMAVVATDSSGNYAVSVPSGEDYRIRVEPVSPYPAQEMILLDLNTGGAMADFSLNKAQVMLVDDDSGMEYEQFYITALQNLGKTFHHWDVAVSGSPGVADMAAYPSKTVLWYTGDAGMPTLSTDEQTALLDHLNNGGMLFLTGQDIAEEINGSNLLSTLGLAYDTDDPQPVVRGVAGDIGDGIILITSGSGGANNQTSKDRMTIINSATTRNIFYYGAVPSTVAGAAYQANGAKAVVFGFGFEGINDASRRELVLGVVLGYLDVIVGIEEPAEAGPLPEAFSLAQNYPNPFNPSTVIEYRVPRSARVDLSVFNELGQKVRTLISGVHSPGLHKVEWDGRDGDGQRVASGVYFYRLNVRGEFTDVKKLILLK